MRPSRQAGTKPKRRKKKPFVRQKEPLDYRPRGKEIPPRKANAEFEGLRIQLREVNNKLDFSSIRFCMACERR
jgi:hypothetical protein